MENQVVGCMACLERRVIELEQNFEKVKAVIELARSVEQAAELHSETFPEQLQSMVDQRNRATQKAVSIFEELHSLARSTRLTIGPQDPSIEHTIVSLRQIESTLERAINLFAEGAIWESEK